MASLQARHQRGCPRGLWTPAKGAKSGCTCGAKLTYVARFWNGAKNMQRTLGRNFEDAKRELGAIEEQQYRKRRGFVAPVENNCTFKEWRARWESDPLRSVKLNTTRSYKPTLDAAERVFGDRVVRTLDRDDVRAVLAELSRQREKPLSTETERRHLRVIAACLEAAVEEGYADRNAAKLPKRQRPKRKKSEPSYFTNAELAALWPHLPSEMPAAVYLYVCRLAVTTGMRQGELLALRWSDIDQLAGEIRVARTYTAGIGEDNPKSGKVRTVDLTPDADAVLSEWVAVVGAKAEGLVFPHPVQDSMGRTRAEAGSHLVPSTLTRLLNKAMTSAGIPKVGEKGGRRDFHSFRNTFARIALEGGRRMDWVQRQLGHSTIVLTVDLYGSWERKAEKEEARGLPKGSFSL